MQKEMEKNLDRIRQETERLQAQYKQLRAEMRALQPVEAEAGSGESTE